MEEQLANREVRAIAVCVVRDGGRTFVAEGRDSARRLTFYRPLGGTIEFGERGIECAAREVLEESGSEVVDLIYLGTLENIFTYEGRPGHEIVLVYEGRFADERMYGLDELMCKEGDVEFRAVWKRFDEFDPESAPLYPEGLIQLLDARPD
jgi:8-oxo-dGTP pyrophosphatase MutT (NUDIX family)